MVLLAVKNSTSREKIAGIDMLPYVKAAITFLGLAPEDALVAENEYRHFMFLVSENDRHDGTIVPSKRADLVWHAHILHTSNYREFCDTVFGRFIDHNPGLERGTNPFNQAVTHTKMLHDRIGRQGFALNYFSYLTDGSAGESDADTPGAAHICGGGGTGGTVDDDE